MKSEEKITGLPRVVSREEWQRERDALLVKEKQMTRALDALAAERRRLPMVEITKDYVFDGPDGKVRPADLFKGRRQLLLYHFMFAPGVCGWPDAGCSGCSMFLDNLCDLSHLRARDVSFAAVSLAPLANIQAYRKRMGWDVTWVSSESTDFNRDFEITTDEEEEHGLSVFLRDGDKIYRTYFTSRRGLEAVGTVWTLLDLTPLGRQELWEDTPPGRPQSEPFEWWRRHDEY
jgi:predicted dithiol-disulfide oxidoreductase (DUF899 family)